LKELLGRSARLRNHYAALYDLLIRTVICLDTISAFYIQFFRMENYHLDARLLCTFAHVNNVSMRAEVKTVESRVIEITTITGMWVSKERRREETNYKQGV